MKLQLIIQALGCENIFESESETLSQTILMIPETHKRDFHWVLGVSLSVEPHVLGFCLTWMLH